MTALLDGKKACAARTCTHSDRLFLHGNVIAEVSRYPGSLAIQEVRMTLAGWPTVTTRERLNGLLQAWAYRVTGTYCRAGFSQRKGAQVFTDLSGQAREVAVDEWLVVRY